MLRLHWRYGVIDVPAEAVSFEKVSNAFTPGEVVNTASFAVNFPPTANNDRAFNHARHLNVAGDVRELDVEVFFDVRYALGKVVLSEAGADGYRGMVSLESLAVELFEQSLSDYQMVEDWTEYFEESLLPDSTEKNLMFYGRLKPKADMPYYCFPLTQVVEPFKDAENYDYPQENEENENWWYQGLWNQFTTFGYVPVSANGVPEDTAMQTAVFPWLILPWVKVRDVLEKILKQKGWRLTGNFATSETLRKMILPCNRALEASQGYLTRVTCKVPTEMTTSTVNQFSTWDTIDLLDTAGENLHKPTDPFWMADDAKVVRITLPGTYIFEVKARISASDPAQWSSRIAIFEADTFPSNPFVLATSFKTVNLAGEDEQLVTAIHEIFLPSVPSEQWVDVAFTPNSVPSGFVGVINYLHLSMARVESIGFIPRFFIPKGTINSFKQQTDAGFMPDIGIGRLLTAMKDAYCLNLSSNPRTKELVIDYAANALARSPVQMQQKLQGYTRQLKQDLKGWDLYFDFNESEDELVKDNFTTPPEITVASLVMERKDNSALHHVLEDAASPGAWAHPVGAELYDSRTGRYVKYRRLVASTRLFERITDAHYHRRRGEKVHQKERVIGLSPVLMTEVLATWYETARVICPTMGMRIRYNTQESEPIKHIKLAYYWGEQEFGFGSATPYTEEKRKYLMASPYSLDAIGTDMDPGGQVDWLQLNAGLTALEASKADILVLKRSLLRRHLPWLELLLYGSVVRGEMKVELLQLLQDIDMRPLQIEHQRYLLMRVEFAYDKGGMANGQWDLMQIRNYMKHRGIVE